MLKMVFYRYASIKLAQSTPLPVPLANEEFQKRTLEILTWLKGVHSIADGCVIEGAEDTKAKTKRES